MTDQVALWPSAQESAPPQEWIEFNVPPQGDEKARVVRVNVSFMLSRWRCIFGQGCPSVMMTSIDPEIGCCQIGVHLEDDEDYRRVAEYVKKLGPDDADNYHLIRKKWFYRDKDETNTDPHGLRHTIVHNGACILANRPNGPAGSQGKVGCSLHHLATKLGLHHADTKPNICWQIPLGWTEDYDDMREVTTCTLTYTPGYMWGHTDTLQRGHIGYWCTETPDAYAPDPSTRDSREQATSGMVFRTNEIELRRIMGDEAYNIMCDHLLAILDHGGRRWPTQGEQANMGRKLIPLMVVNRMRMWEREGDVEAISESEKRAPELLARIRTGEDNKQQEASE